MEIVEAGWLGELVRQASRPGVGAVGARLLFPDGALQHAGVVIGLDGVAAHVFREVGAEALPTQTHCERALELSAVTGACLLTKRANYWRVGGLDEANFPIAFNDIDFCLRLRELGLRNVYTPFATLIHHESKSRGKDVSPSEKARFAREIGAFETRWKHWIMADPAYNPNLALSGTGFDLSSNPRARKYWR
jgi:GT2 family glycosyltransferase